MPRIVNYADRFDAIREAVYLVTLREGAQAITLPTVAQQLRMSESTVRRLLASATRLPELGLQWVHRRERTTLSRAVPGAYPPEHPWSRYVNPLLGLVPSAEEHADDARVRRALTVAFAGVAWADSSAADYLRATAGCVGRALAVVPDMSAEAADYERARLVALTLGLTEGVCVGEVAPHDLVPVLKRHIEAFAPPQDDFLVAHSRSRSIRACS